MSVDIILYEKHKHRDFVDGWLSYREMKTSLGDDLPVHSYMAVHQNLPIGAAGILKTDGEDCFLMGLITNPKAENYLRSEAIDALTEYLIQKSKTLGFKRLFAWSSNEGVIKRSKKHGFVPLQQVMIGLDLKGE